MFRRKQNQVNLALLTIFIDASLTFLIFFLFDTVCEQGLVPSWAPGGGQCMPDWSYAAVPFFWVLSFFISSAYDPKRVFRIVDEFQTVLQSILLGFFLFSGFMFLVGLDIRRSIFLYFILADIILLLGWRLLFRLYDRTRPSDAAAKTFLIVGAGSAGQLIAETIKNQSAEEHHVLGFLDDGCHGDQKTINGLPLLGQTADLRQIIKARKVDEVIFALPINQYENVVQRVLEIDDIPVRVRIIPTYFKLTYHRTKVENFYGIPLIGLRDPSLNEVQLLFKRIFDTLFALLALLLLWPLMAVIALLIRLGSKGPVFFRQVRIGENTQEFHMLKFRTMYDEYSDPSGTAGGQENGTETGEKTADDPRVTPIGRFLRRSSLDELPQLINILKGDMSVVGPRPEMPWRVADYEPWQRVRFTVPQGLTGWWQINGRADRPMHLNTQDDLYYIENYSIWLDLQIILKTPLVVLQGKGAF